MLGVNRQEDVECRDPPLPERTWHIKGNIFVCVCIMICSVEKGSLYNFMIN